MPVCQCCPNFISPGVERCENCATPAGALADCPTCGREVLRGSEQCRHCGYYINDDGDEGSEYPFPETDSSGFDTESDDEDEDYETFDDELREDF